MIFTVFSENFLPENKLCSWLFTDLQNTHAFSWPCKLSWFSPGQEKSHVFYKHIYNYLYYSFSLIMSVHDNTVIGTFWLCCDCPRCLKQCSDDWDNQMKTLPRRLKMTRMTETTSIDRLNRVEFYLDDWEDRVNFEVIWKCSQMTETITEEDQRLSQKSSLSFH